MASRTRSSSGRLRSILCGALACGAVAAGLAASRTDAAHGGRHPATSHFAVCLAVDNGVGSALNRLAIAGLEQARAAGVTVYIRRASAPVPDAVPLRACLLTGATLTIGVGLLMENALDAVAEAHPERRFAIVNAGIASLAHRPRNVTGIVFRAEQAGYLVGYAAGLWAKLHPVDGRSVVGSVGSLSIPPVDSYLAGFRFGARRADPDVTVVNHYTQDALDQAKCRRSAREEIAKGASVVFAVAGPCGQGVFSVARAQGVLAIGSEAAPIPAASWLMTSAVKRADTAVLAAVEAARSETLQGGTDLILGLKQGGLGYGGWSARVPPSIRASVARQAALLRTGKLRGIPSTL
jgi:basic membrane protein A